PTPPPAMRSSPWSSSRPRAPPSTTTATSRYAARHSVPWPWPCRASSRGGRGDGSPAVQAAGVPMTLTRAEKSVLTDWWFSVDRMLLATVLVLAGAGVVLSLAASPAIAIKNGLPTYYYVERQLAFIALALFVMFSLSLLSPAGIRRLALVAFAACVV